MRRAFLHLSAIISSCSLSLMFSFLTWSLSVWPHAHLHIFISVIFIISSLILDFRTTLSFNDKERPHIPCSQLELIQSTLSEGVHNCVRWQLYNPIWQPGLNEIFKMANSPSYTEDLYRSTYILNDYQTELQNNGNYSYSHVMVETTFMIPMPI